MSPSTGLDKLTHEWWETVCIRRGGEYVYDDEIKAVNALAAGLSEIPDWALQARGAMPRSGFEMCSHRWLEGLGDVLTMLGEERHSASQAGHCGDVPDAIFEATWQRAEAVRAWLSGRVADNAVGCRVAGWLGDPTTEKTEAATCFVELIDAGVRKGGPAEAYGDLRKRWRARAEVNPILKTIFTAGEGLDVLLDNNCGFKIIDRLDIVLRVIGGDESEVGDLPGACVRRQVALALRDDPPRYYTTLGYLWGLDAYLAGHDEKWLRANKPQVADAAAHALTTVSRAGRPTSLRQWLVASMLKATKLWCENLLAEVGAAALPPHGRDLPDVLAALGA